MPTSPLKLLRPLVLAALAAGLASQVEAAVKLPPVVASHMVLQRDAAVPIWGTAAPNETVVVKFRDQKHAVAADAQGKWLVKLDPLKAGGPDAMTIAGENTIQLEDVLVGEVWVGSGQSNMDMPVKSYTQGDEVLAKLAAESHPKIRILRAGGTWKKAEPEANAAMSALLFSFGVPLQKELDVPVGLMVGAVGGTPSGYWLSEASYREDAPCKALAEKGAAAYSAEEAEAKYKTELAAWEAKYAEDAKAKKKVPNKPKLKIKPGECYGKIGNLYESRIRPFQPYAIRGVLWDQGESGTNLEGIDQYTLMGALVRGWRKEWGQGDFPFIYIQKPSGGGCAFDPENPATKFANKFQPLPKTAPGDGEYVENHLKIASYPLTAMATASDLGPGTHPVCKSGYGARAASVALGMVYGGKHEYLGPTYASHAVDGNKVRIKFTHVGQGLAQKHGDKLQGFSVAGDDKKFQWAEAAIDGDEVVLTLPSGLKPTAVRYAYARSAPWANLFNKDGLPALPFRTDSW